VEKVHWEFDLLQVYLLIQRHYQKSFFETMSAEFLHVNKNYVEADCNFFQKFGGIKGVASFITACDPAEGCKKYKRFKRFLYLWL
jgi:hypothetical protein